MVLIRHFAEPVFSWPDTQNTSNLFGTAFQTSSLHNRATMCFFLIADHFALSPTKVLVNVCDSHCAQQAALVSFNILSECYE